MRKHVTLITGAGGEIGHGLIERLTADGDTAIITIDLQPLEHRLAATVEQEYRGSILETSSGPAGSPGSPGRGRLLGGRDRPEHSGG